MFSPIFCSITKALCVKNDYKFQPTFTISKLCLHHSSILQCNIAIMPISRVLACFKHVNPYPADHDFGLLSFLNLFYLSIKSLILGMKLVFKHPDL